MNFRNTVILGLFSVTALMSLNVQAYSGDKYEKEAKITLKEARAIALKSYSGKIVDEELEHKPGGSGLRFSFDISAHHVTHEVGIDAQTGAVLKNEEDDD